MDSYGTVKGYQANNTWFGWTDLGDEAETKDKF